MSLGSQMTSTDVNITPTSIAPAPASWSSSIDSKANGHTPQQTMQYACRPCSSKKIKCDKVAPVCSSCRKGKVECIWQAPPPRSRKRKLSTDGNDKIARYERILLQHGLLPEDDDTLASNDDAAQEPVSLRFTEPETSRAGKLLAGHGKSRYVNSNLWRSLGDDEMQHMSEEDEEDPFASGEIGDFASDPMTGAFLGFQQSPFKYHPSHSDALLLWKKHLETVEPICKILHIPSTSEMVERVSQQPLMASKAEECLLFAIYHFAVFSMTDEECTTTLSSGLSRAALMHRYNVATKQALVNASFLKTTEMSILQALVLFLIPCRYSYDTHTYWILTGVAVRIGQRMGLHRDGNNLGLPPFDVQMRRRLFYQLLPLDGMASQAAGTGMAVELWWDTEQPLNINDDQIWPGMTEPPKEQKGPTEMIFCLARACIGKYFVKSLVNAGRSMFKDYTQAEPLIDQAESEVEEKFIRYCDIVNPLHYLTICHARSAITAMRLRVRLPKVWNKTVTHEERREIFQLAQKIIDTDITACGNASLQKYSWQVRSFFAMGSWDSLIFILTTLRKSDLLTPTETDATWSRVEQVFNNRLDLIESKRALHIAVGRFAIKAWDANPSRTSVTEPSFITSLRSRQTLNRENRAERLESNATTLDVQSNTISSMDPSPTSDVDALFATLPDGMSFDLGNNFTLDNADWMFWDRLIMDAR